MPTNSDASGSWEMNPAAAPWKELPDVVGEVQALSEPFSDANVSAADMLCDKHPADAVAFHLVDAELRHVPLSFRDLADRSRRLATALGEQGVDRGDRVGVLMAKTGQLPVVAMALWRLGAVYVPLFTAFAGPAIKMRVHAAGARLIVADADQTDKLGGVDAECSPPANHSRQMSPLGRPKLWAAMCATTGARPNREWRS